MANPKARALELIHQMPDDSTWGNLIYRLYFVGNLEKAIESADTEEGIPNEQVMKEMEEWLKSCGSRQPEPDFDE